MGPSIFLPIFEALAKAEVRYVTVGGLATVLHGYARFTADLDLIVALDPANCRRAITALVGIGFRPRAPVDPFEFADPAKRQEWIDTRSLTVFSLYGTSGLPVEVDLFADTPIDFEELWEHRVQRRVGDTVIQVVDKDSLITLKRISGRPQDLEDIAGLEDAADE